MLQLLWRTCALLLSALGAVHTRPTVPFYGQRSPEAVWLAGTGLMMVFLGLLSLMARRTADPGARRLCQGADLLGFLFGVLSVLAVSEPRRSSAWGFCSGSQSAPSSRCRTMSE